MSKNRKIDLRVTAEELADIERICKGLHLSKSDYLRAVALGGTVAKPAPAAAPAAATTGGIDEKRLDEIDARLAEIDESLSASARAFDALLQKLGEAIRAPSFAEYRMRAGVDGIKKRETEDINAYMLRLAESYFLAFDLWPDPADLRTFGSHSPGFDASKFPKSPPG